jgi:membrane fusion protein (multidrug efflux system)
MRMPAMMLVVMTAALLIAPAGAQDTVNLPRKEQVQEPGKKVEELQRERLAALEELTDQLTRLYQNARVDIDELLEARVQLFQARLDSAEKQSDRLTLYKNLVEELKQFEKIAQGRVEAARGSVASVLKVKARRLEAEIHLEEAKPEEPNGKHQKIVVTSPQVKNVTVKQQYVCQIHVQRHIEIRTLQKGYIETILVKEGQAVRKGDLVFTMVPDLYKAKLDVELANVKIAEQELQNAQRLFRNKVVGPNEVALLETKLEKAKAGAELAKAELNVTEVRAPFDGIIDRLHEQPGSMIKEGEALTTLSDNSSMSVYFNVPEARYLEYMAGLEQHEKDDRIELKLANGKVFPQVGKISAIEAIFTTDTGTIPFRADFPNPDRLLRHGMTGTVLISLTEKGALVIPQRATFEILDKRYVYVVDKADVAHRREIVVQHELDDFFVVAGGVGADDRIVVEGTQGVHDGERVEYEFHPPDRIPGDQQSP